MLYRRSDSMCELCGSADDLDPYDVPPDPDNSVDTRILNCRYCREQIEDRVKIDVNHWRCLNDSMWSQVPVVQVMAWRMLTRLRTEGWAQDLLEMLYLDENMLAWARVTEEDSNDEGSVKYVDSNGALLAAGDTVTLIKDLNVKGAGFTAKRGTAVRGISLVSDNPEQIEGRVEGQQIVILTKFVKKSN